MTGTLTTTLKHFYIILVHMFLFYILKDIALFVLHYSAETLTKTNFHLGHNWNVCF